MSHDKSSVPAGSEHRRLNSKDYKTLSLAALGGALEFYDFIIFVFLAAIVGQHFFPANIPDWLRQFQTYGIFAAGYLARPLGGIIMAHFGDLVGRKKMFNLSILLMALPTLLMGLLPTYDSIGIFAPLCLLLLRILQGAAIGGEVPGAWVFVSEHVPSHRIGYACGSLTAGLTAGILLGSLVATALHTLLPQAHIIAWGWRIPFLLGGLFGLFAMMLRRWLEETPIFNEMKAKKQLVEGLPLKQVLGNSKPEVVMSMLLTWMLSAAIVVVILMTPTYLQKQLAIAPTAALQANSLATVTLTLGCIFFGWLNDRINSGLVFIVGSIGLAVTTYVFYHGVAADPSLLLVLYPLVGFFVGIVGAVPYAMVMAFPPAIRFSGISFSYNLSYAIFGGLTPMVVALWLKNEPMAPCYYVIMLCVVGAAVGCWLLQQQLRQESTALAEAN